MSKWDNQQEISWFAGILEGEGCFGSKDIRIGNTDTDILDNCKRILEAHSIPYVVYEKKQKTRGGKKFFDLRVVGDSCELLYNAIVHKVECRRQQFQRLMSSSEIECAPTVDHAWLIGAWEAEGSFCFIKARGERYKPAITFVNTNKKMVEKVRLTLDALGCSYYCQDSATTKKTPYTRVMIVGFKRCHKFLIANRGLWKSRKSNAKAELMLEWIESRLPKYPKDAYSDREVSIYNQMRQLNG